VPPVTLECRQAPQARNYVVQNMRVWGMILYDDEPGAQDMDYSTSLKVSISFSSVS
jgi:hypothetical protein